MANCGPNEIDTTADKFGAYFGLGAILFTYVLYLVFVILVFLSIRGGLNSKAAIHSTSPAKETIKVSISRVYDLLKQLVSKFTKTNKALEDTFMNRFNEWFSRVSKSINIGSVIAILAASVVVGFNGMIMTPIIASMFPPDFRLNIPVPGREDIVVNPGQFFIAFIGFIISLILFFFLAQFVYIICQHFENWLTGLILLVLFVFLTFMLAWNAMNVDNLRKQPDCMVVTMSTSPSSSPSSPSAQLLELPTFQFKSINTSKPTSPPVNSKNKKLPTFGVFG